MQLDGQLSLFHAIGETSILAGSQRALVDARCLSRLPIVRKFSLHPCMSRVPSSLILSIGLFISVRRVVAETEHNQRTSD